MQAANALDKYIVSARDFDCTAKSRGHLFGAIVWPALSARMRRHTEHKSCMKTKTPTCGPHGTDKVAILIVDRDSPFDFLSVEHSPLRHNESCRGLAKEDDW